jgi:transcriptional regulator with GAF, ATPase, and Fis domain/tetratricopeptide (TPR) repeat protein
MMAQRIGGRYIVLGLLGQGGMGEVFRVRDMHLGQELALKRLLHVAIDPLFRSEFGLLRRLAHPHLPEVHRFGVDEATSRPYFTMELCEGRPWSEWAAELRAADGQGAPGAILPPLADVAAQLFRTLTHIHEHGHVHGDLNPANLVVSTRAGLPHLCLLDFGVSAEAHRPGTVSGALPYLAPERLEGGAPSVASDLFGAGVLLAEAITGEHPFPGYPRTPVRALPRWGDERPLARTLRPLVERLVAAAPEDRPSSALEAHQELERLIGAPVPQVTSEIVAVRARRVERVDAGGESEVGATAVRALVERARGGLVQVDGPPGSGRSRLLRDWGELACELGASELTTACRDGEPLLAPVDRILESALGPFDEPPPSELDQLPAAARRAVLGRAPAWAATRGVSLASQADDPRARERQIDGLAQALLALSARRPMLVGFDDADRADADSRDVILALARGIAAGLPPRPQLALVVVGLALPEDCHPSRASASPLDAQGVRTYLERVFPGRRAARDLVRRLRERSGGNALLLAESVAELFATGGIAVGPGDVSLGADASAWSAAPAGVGDLVRGRVAALDAERSRILAALALVGVDVDVDLLARLGAFEPDALRVALNALAAQGLVVRMDAASRLEWGVASSTAREAAIECLDAVQVRVLHARACEVLSERDEPGLRMAGAIHGLASGNGAEPAAVERALAIAGELLDRALAGDAWRVLDRVDADAVQDADLRQRVRRLQGEVLTALSRFDEAERALKSLLDDAGGAVARASAERLLGTLSIRRGAHRDAVEWLAGAALVLEGLPDRDEEVADVESWLAHAQLFGGEYPEAAATCARALERLDAMGPLAGPVTRARLAHTRGLAAFYQGDFEVALDHFEEARARSERLGRAVENAHAANCIGLVHHRRDRYEAALDAYRSALDVFEEAGERGSQGAVLMNMGVVYQERGDYARALEQYERALGIAEAIGHRVGVIRNSSNLGNAYRTVGDHERARKYVQRSLDLARQEADRLIEGYDLTLLGELARLEGAFESAGALLGEARSVFEALGAASELIEVDVERGWLAHDLGDYADARALALRAVDAAREQGLRDVQVKALTLAAEAERLIPGGDLDAVDHRLEAAVRIGQELDNREVVWPALVGRARAARDQGDLEAACGHGLEALEILRSLLRSLPPELQSRYAASRPRREVLAELRWVEALYRAGGRAPVGAGAASPTWGKLLEINKRLNSEHDLVRLLEYIMDSAILLTGAERGFLLLRDPEGEGGLTIKVARNFDRENIRNVKFKISRSIAERVLEEAEPIITVDAMEDSRYREYLSIHSLRLRSILCVPMRRGGMAMGVLYLDNRFQANAFDDENVQFMEAFADQAAIAIANAELIEDKERARQELEASRKEVAQLNLRLEQKLLQTSAQLEETRTRIERQQRQLENRHRYENIVGQSARLREVLFVIDRVRDNDIPVLITGESGTGKELVARAIHYNGQRRDGEFVAVNCGSIPATLFESELFGHVRGAFTGASTDKRGLFEVAHRGTLFLDEIGELPLETQVKLLRALQSGEIQKVGSTRAVKVDARILAATNRDLREDVRNKTFREDLYYRLNVVHVPMPPLRERLEDIPQLVQSFIKKNSEAGLCRVQGIEPAALALLARYHWPGNIRELDTAIKNASVFAEGLSLTVRDFAHLPELVEAASGSPKGGRPRAGGSGAAGIFEAGMSLAELEREAIIRTIEAFGGNKKRSAEALGIDRRTLYNKLDAYDIRVEKRARVVKRR